MHIPSGEGGTLYDELKSAEKQIGYTPEELRNEPSIPDLFKESWNWFAKLSAKRTTNGFGLNPLSYQEMLSYFWLIETKPMFYEIQAIELFDSVFMDVYSSKQKQKQDKQKK